MKKDIPVPKDLKSVLDLIVLQNAPEKDAAGNVLCGNILVGCDLSGSQAILTFESQDCICTAP